MRRHESKEVGRVRASRDHSLIVMQSSAAFGGVPIGKAGRGGMSFRTTFGGHTCYFICLFCHVTMGREFVACCDRRGQRLDWENYRSAIVIFPFHR